MRVIMDSFKPLISLGIFLGDLAVICHSKAAGTAWHLQPPDKYSGEYLRLSRGRPRFDSPPRSTFVGAVAECVIFRLEIQRAGVRFPLVSCRLANPASSWLIARRMGWRWFAWSLQGPRHSQTRKLGNTPCPRTPGLRPATVPSLRTLAGPIYGQSGHP